MMDENWLIKENDEADLDSNNVRGRPKWMLVDPIKQVLQRGQEFYESKSGRCVWRS
jgi:hypothetical protein